MLKVKIDADLDGRLQQARTEQPAKLFHDRVPGKFLNAIFVLDRMGMTSCPNLDSELQWRLRRRFSKGRIRISSSNAHRLRR
jgi:hypothetical protein